MNVTEENICDDNKKQLWYESVEHREVKAVG